MSESKQRFEWIDFARFAAALTVLCYHYLVNGARNGKLVGLQPTENITHAVAQYGYLGVNLFFMISGFVIMNSAASGSAIEFAISRIFRLWPAFVVCMTATSAILLLLPSPKMPVSSYQFLANLTMMPTALGFMPIDGVYWTLRLEVMFYAAVFFILALRLIDSIEIIIQGWIAMQIASVATGTGYWFLEGYDPYFAAGCMLFFVQQKGVSVRALAFIAACLIMAIWLSRPITDYINTAYGPTLSHVVVAAIIASFFGVFLSLALHGSARELTGARLVGALTYPMYLLHAYIGYTLMSNFGFAQYPNATVTIMIALVLGASFIVVQFVEKPAQRLRSITELRVRSALQICARLQGKSHRFARRQRAECASASEQNQRSP